MDNNDLITKIEHMTPSQVDKSNIKEETFNKLMGFLGGYMDKASANSKLKTKVDELLLAKLEAEEEEIPYGVLIKLEEILSKGETDAAIPILKIIESATKSEKESDVPLQGNTNPDSIEGKVTTEEFKQLKTLLNIVQDLKKSEFVEGELK